MRGVGVGAGARAEGRHLGSGRNSKGAEQPVPSRGGGQPATARRPLGSSPCLACGPVGSWAPHVCRASCRPLPPQRNSPEGPGGAGADLGAEARPPVSLARPNCGKGCWAQSLKDQLAPVS